MAPETAATSWISTGALPGSVATPTAARLPIPTSPSSACRKAEAKSEGLLVWSLPGNQGQLSVSTLLLRDYARWQSVKFHAIATAYAQAVRA